LPLFWVLFFRAFVFILRKHCTLERRRTQALDEDKSCKKEERFEDVFSPDKR
jgi:hypothetical protein